MTTIGTKHIVLVLRVNDAVDAKDLQGMLNDVIRHGEEQARIVLDAVVHDISMGEITNPEFMEEEYGKIEEKKQKERS